MSEPELDPPPPTKGTMITKGGGGCDSNGNRFDIVHDGSGGTMRRRVYDISYCPLPNSTSSITIVKSEFQSRYDSNNHDFYTNLFSGWQLLIEITGRDIEIRVYKNGNLYHTFNERGRLNDLWFDSSNNILVTNRTGWSVGKKQHRIILNNKQSNESLTGGYLYNGTGFTRINLIQN